MQLKCQAVEPLLQVDTNVLATYYYMEFISKHRFPQSPQKFPHLRPCPVLQLLLGLPQGVGDVLLETILKQVCHQHLGMVQNEMDTPNGRMIVPAKNHQVWSNMCIDVSPTLLAENWG